MEWVARWNAAIDYIEANLTGEIDTAHLGRLACCSPYHFQRMFTYLAGMPLSEYIRRRKMSLAAVDLLAGGKIIDVALNYGYQSPTAFNRAFQSVHGIAPSAVKAEGISVRSYSPIRFIMTVKGAQEMNYRVETKEAFRVVGKSIPISREMERNFEEVPKLWQRVARDGTLSRLIPLMNTPPMGVLGICGCGEEEAGRYMIAVASDVEAPEGLESYVVPAFTWAIFPGEGECPAAIQQLVHQIITEWLPTSGYEYTNGPDVEVYLPDTRQAKFEVWVPVRRA